MRVAALIVETAPQSGDYIALNQGHDVDGMKQALKAMPAGDQRALLLSTPGVLKRRKVTFLPAGATKPKRTYKRRAADSGDS